MPDLIIVFLLLIWMHFLGDFILQTNKMALNKSTSNFWLGVHCLVYGLPFLYFGLEYYAVNVILHFIVDFMTSRATSYFWKREKRLLFFIAIGFDQSLHFTILILTYFYIVA